MSDNLTVEQRRKNMKNIKYKDTKIELVLRKALWEKGYRYRKNYAKLPGKPDIVFIKDKVVVFCDSEFFHGKDWKLLQKRLQNTKNKDYWIKKISRNIERDKEVNNKLASLGWEVIRFWGKDILSDTDSCVNTIEKILSNRKDIKS
ncbi:very short patch repair endonuclease [Anaerofustis sp. LCP19S3_F7]|uniref:very short patch repair endonuclease n=1 Tax=Anaerofustis sp. LCP19S3_F7 TaxID=3440247 RepID=UPI003F8DC5EB